MSVRGLSRGEVTDRGPNPSASDGGPAVAGNSAFYVVKNDGVTRLALTSLLTAAGFSPLTFDTGGAFLAACDRLPPGCVITGSQPSGMEAAEFLHCLNAHPVSFPTIIVENAGEVMQAVEAMKAGAATILERPYDGAALLSAVRAALEMNVAGAIQAAKRLAIASLTRREHEVLCLLMDGKTNKMSARHLGISSRTVEIHRANLMRKAGVGSVAELVRLAIAADLHC
jgi:two-component system response regulator FixJ